MLTRDEYNLYRKTLFQEHLYELIFKEAEAGPDAAVSSPSKCRMPLANLSAAIQSHWATLVAEVFHAPSHSSHRMKVKPRLCSDSDGITIHTSVPRHNLIWVPIKFNNIVQDGQIG